MRTSESIDKKHALSFNVKYNSKFIHTKTFNEKKSEIKKCLLNKQSHKKSSKFVFSHDTKNNLMLSLIKKRVRDEC